MGRRIVLMPDRYGIDKMLQIKENIVDIFVEQFRFFVYGMEKLLSKELVNEILDAIIYQAQKMKGR